MATNQFPSLLRDLLYIHDPTQPALLGRVLYSQQSHVPRAAGVPVICLSLEVMGRGREGGRCLSRKSGREGREMSIPFGLAGRIMGAAAPRGWGLLEEGTVAGLVF